MALRLIKDTREKVNSIRGSGRGAQVASYLSIGASIADKVGTCVPAVGMVGGAMKMCSNILDPSAKLSHLKAESEKLAKMLEASSDSLREQLKTAMDVSQKNINAEIQCQLEMSLRGMTEDLKKIDNDLGPMKDLGRDTYQLVVDIRYKEGMDMIDSAYQVFLRGSKYFKTTHNLLSNYIFELETKAGCTFGSDNIEMYLKRVASIKGHQEAMKLATYVFVVRAKYLQLVTAFYLFINETEKVEQEFKSFEDDVKELERIHKKVFNVDFAPQDLANTAARKIQQPQAPTASAGASSYPTSAFNQMSVKDSGKTLKPLGNLSVSISYE